MSVYLRKSIQVGPLRFNISNSGVGVSAGVPGLRIGTGPRGNYVHIGRNGIYYRHTVTPPHQSATTTPSTSVIELERGDVNKMVDASSAQLLDEIKSKQKLRTRWPWVLLFFSLVAGWTVRNALNGIYSFWPVISTVLPGIVFTRKTFIDDNLRKATVIFYNLEDEPQALYEELIRAFKSVASCSRVWHLKSAIEVDDTRENSGAQRLVDREEIVLICKNPPCVEINVDAPRIPAGQRTLYFLPDKILVFSMAGVGAVGYDELEIEIESGQFIENGPVPTDAKVVGYTWQHPKMDGGRDHRFKENRKLNIAQYDHLLLSSPSGLVEVLEISCVGRAEALKQALTALGGYYRKKQLAS